MLFGEDMPPDMELSMLLPEVEPFEPRWWRLLLVAPIEPEDEVEPMAPPEPDWPPIEP